MWRIGPEEFRGTPCWLWERGCNSDGYGQVIVEGRQRPAHVAVYEAIHGPVPEGLELDHLCRRRACCNPRHLEAVTHWENLMRSPIAPAAINARKIECAQGHALTPDNVVSRRGRRRDCRTCHRDRERVRRAARKGA